MNIFHAHYEFLKNEADLLLKGALSSDSASLERFRSSSISPKVAEDPSTLQLKYALQVIATENDYATWSDLKAALDHAAETSPLAEVTDQFYPKGLTTYWNIWFAHYSQAKKVLLEGKGYLLPFKNQFFIVEEHFVDSIGIPQTLPEWEAIGNDWAHPKKVKPWLALNERYAAAIAARTAPAAP